MIEQGLELLIQSALGNPPMAPGGFNSQLPKDFISPTNQCAWTYRSITSEPSYTLGGQDGWTSLEIQIDCHGYSAANAFTLARAIESILRGGYSGTLSDPDRTVVQGIFRTGTYIDGFSDVNRSYVRTMEYVVQYAQI
jgi:hypothetical protein